MMSNLPLPLATAGDLRQPSAQRQQRADSDAGSEQEDTTESHFPYVTFPLRREAVVVVVPGTCQRERYKQEEQKAGSDTGVNAHDSFIDAASGTLYPQAHGADTDSLPRARVRVETPQAFNWCTRCSLGGPVDA
jgi:hypothetical protein